jgi:hypothetical protein
MRLAASVVLLAVLAAGCDSKASSTAPATTKGVTCFTHAVTVGAVPAEVVDWAAEGRACVRSRIEEELEGTGATIRCGRLRRGRASCRANWTESTNTYCTGEFSFHAYGTLIDRFVDVSEGSSVCSTI